MIFGFEVTLRIMVLGGAILLTLLLFQVLAGLRIITLGRKNRTVHKWTGIAVLGIAVLHGFLGVVLTFGLKVL
jgi:hypothetical protein